MNYRPASVLVAAFFAVALSGCNSAEKPKESVTTTTEKPKKAVTTTTSTQTTEKPLTVKESVEVSVTAQVKAIDQASRVVTLRDKAGNEVTFVVDKVVRRLHEVKAGDDVTARYTAVLVAELRPPTAEERAKPIAMVGVEARSPHGSTPAGSVAQAIRVVTTVEAVDVPNMRVTLRGPMGDLTVVRGRNPENVKRLRVGDTIVITYTESVAMVLDKIAPR